MKIKNYGYTLTISILFLIFAGCNQQKYEPIYKTGKSWKFLVKSSSSSEIDTLNYYIHNDKNDTTQQIVAWSYKYIDSTGNTASDSSSSVVSKSIGKDDNYVNLTIPQFKQMFNNKYFLVPRIKLPVEINYSAKMSLQDFDAEGNPKSVKNEYNIKVTDKMFYKNPAVKDTCCVINSDNLNSNQNVAKYYFHEKYGFVYMLFKDNSENIGIELIKFE